MDRFIARIIVDTFLFFLLIKKKNLFWTVSAALRSLDEALAAAGGTDEDDVLPEPLFRIGANDPVDLDENTSDTDSDSSGNSLFSSRSSFFSHSGFLARILSSFLKDYVRNSSSRFQGFIWNRLEILLSLATNQV